MDTRRISVKFFIAFVSVISFIFLSVYLFNSNIFIPSHLLPTSTSQSALFDYGGLSKQRSVKNASLATFSYAERAAFYHNTVDLDYFHREDFQKEPPPDRQLSSAKELLRAKIIRAERLYTEKVAERTSFLSAHSKEKANNTLESLQNIFQPAFNCPFLVEDVSEVGGVDGDKEWICGFELYKNYPRPQECVVYTFGTGPTLRYERKWLVKTDCKVFKFGFNGKELSKRPMVDIPNSKQLETFPGLTVGTVDLESKVKTLRAIMKQNDHGWLDTLVLDMNGEIYNILEFFIKDFTVQVLPFAQLIVKFPVVKQDKFIEMFTELESQGLRPYHVSSNSDQKILQYSFFNLRGKHLLLVGEE